MKECEATTTEVDLVEVEQIVEKLERGERKLIIKKVLVRRGVIWCGQVVLWSGVVSVWSDVLRSDEESH